MIVDGIGIEVACHPITDVRGLTPEALRRLSFHDPGRAPVPPPAAGGGPALDVPTLLAYTGAAMADPTLLRGTGAPAAGRDARPATRCDP